MSMSFDSHHEDMIHDVQPNFYGTQVATCSSDRTVKVFDVVDDKTTLVETLTGHEGPVWQVAWAHPSAGRVLASCSYDSRVFIWKDADGNGHWERAHEYKDHESSVNSIAWAPHEFGVMLACASSDGCVSVLKFNEDDQSWTANKFSAHSIGCNAVSWAPCVNAEDSPRFVSGGCDNLVKIWKNESGKWVLDETLEKHTDWVRDVAWAPSVGMASETIASCSQDHTVYIWTKDDEGSGWSPTLLNEFSDTVWRLSWSVTGNILAVSGGDAKVTLWKESLEGDWALVNSMKEGAILDDATDDAAAQSS